MHYTITEENELNVVGAGGGEDEDDLEEEETDVSDEMESRSQSEDDPPAWLWDSDLLDGNIKQLDRNEMEVRRMIC